MTKVNELHNKWLKKADYLSAYEELEEEFSLANALIAVQSRVGLTQEPFPIECKPNNDIALLESGHVMLPLSTPKRSKNR